MVLHSLTHLAYSYTPLHTIEHSYIPSHTLTHSYTPSQAYTCGHMYIVSGLTTLRPLTCCHKFTVSMVTPPTRPCTWSHISSFQGNLHTQTLHIVSLVHSLQGEPFPDPTPGVTCPQSPQGPHTTYPVPGVRVTLFPDPVPGVTCP